MLRADVPKLGLVAVPGGADLLRGADEALGRAELVDGVLTWFVVLPWAVDVEERPTEGGM